MTTEVNELKLSPSSCAEKTENLSQNYQNNLTEYNKTEKPHSFETVDTNGMTYSLKMSHASSYDHAFKSRCDGRLIE